MAWSFRPRRRGRLVLSVAAEMVICLYCPAYDTPAHSCAGKRAAMENGDRAIGVRQCEADACEMDRDITWMRAQEMRAMIGEVRKRADANERLERALRQADFRQPG